VKKNLGPPLCSLDNKANIATPPGGTPTNLLPGDDFDHAKATIPDPACFGPHPHTDLKITKSATGCAPDIHLGVNGYTCGWTITVTNVGPNTYNGPLTFKSDYKKVSAYFNIDNGTGKLRGIYCQENAAVCPIFQQWLEPFRDLGVTTVSMRNTGSTDHVPFDAVGVPGFQFIQDPVEYFTRTHHTNMDVYERIQRDDVMQAAVVLASVVWQAANRDQMLPRKPLSKDSLQRANTPPATTPATAKAASSGGGK